MGYRITGRKLAIGTIGLLASGVLGYVPLLVTAPTAAAATTGTPGAQLPVSYSLGSLTGTVRYVSPSGSDSASGSVSAPLRTLTRAEALSAAGDTIVVRGGTYPISANITRIDRANVDVVAYPGEVPVFDGSIAAPSPTTAEGTMRYVAYQPIPAAIGEGLSLSSLPAAFSGTTPTALASDRGWMCVTSSTTYAAPAPTATDPDGCASSATARVISAYYPDQVWLNGQQLVQVLSKAKVRAGTFYVQRSSSTDGAPGASRLYLSSADSADMSKVRVSSSKGDFLQIAASGVRIEGLRIKNHSATWNNRTISVGSTGDGLVLRNVELDSTAGIAIKLAGGGASGGTQLLKNVRLDRVSVLRPGWMGAVAMFTDDLTVADSLVRSANPHSEFAIAPQAGAIKLSRAYKTTVVRSLFERNVGHAVWWDQSGYRAVVADSRFVENTGSGVYFEISHGLTMVNNTVIAKGTDAGVTLGGASGVRLVNNTIIGGKDGVRVYADTRSRKYDSNGDGTKDRWCAEHAARYGSSASYVAACGGSTSDLDYARPGAYGTTNLTPGLAFMPAIDMLLNNVIANPTGTGRCGPVISLCVAGYTTAGGGVQVAMNSVIHSGTVINGNVYQTTSGYIAKGHVASGQAGGFVVKDLAGLKAALAASYYGKSVEANGKSGTGWVNADGTPTAALAAAQSQAAPVPTDATINTYVPAGTKHYGAMG